MVVDVSGSMVVTVAGSDVTRLEATIDAAIQSLDVLPDSSDVGLWEFSTDLSGGSNDGDYRELVTLGALHEDAGGTLRKERIIAALEGLAPANDTALNDTTLAAFETMQETNEPDARQTVVLLTDGRNDDDGSISNDEVVARLEELHDDDRPVRIVAIAYGEQTDIAQLERMAEATGGKVLASPNEEDIDALFLEALSGT